VLEVASGDQEVLGAADSITGMLYSLTELSNSTRTSASTQVNWMKAFANGERVVGPMVLFNGWLYFATYRPPDASTAECSSGTSYVWQASYLDRKVKSDSSQGPLVLSQLAQFDAVTAGVAGMQDPDCSTVFDNALGDAILGFGHQISLTQISTGNFKLVYHTGNLKQSSDTSGAAVGVGEVTLPPPPTFSSVESWASITE